MPRVVFYGREPEIRQFCVYYKKLIEVKDGNKEATYCRILK